MIVHYFDRRTMAYTSCWKLPFGLKHTAKHEEVTCPGCLAGLLTLAAFRIGNLEVEGIVIKR